MKLVDIVGARPQFIKVRPVESGWNVVVAVFAPRYDGTAIRISKKER